MAGLPFNIEPPAWLQDEERWAKNSPIRDLAMQNQRVNLASGLLGLQQQEQGLEMNQLRIQQMSQGSADVHDWMQQSQGDPVWMVNHPYTGTNPMAEQAIGKAQVAASKSVMVKKAMEDTVMFNKRLTALPPDSRAAVQSMSNDPKTGLPTAQKWQALGMAESAEQQRLANIAEAQRLEGIISGAAVTTRVTPKGGVETTVRQPAPKDSLGDEQPQTKTLPDGTIMAWKPRGNAIHIIKGPDSKKMTPSQLLALGKALPDTDPRKQEFIDAAVSAGEAQIGKSKTAPTATAKPTRIRVKGPNGQTGTIDSTDTLPQGWTKIP